MAWRDTRTETDMKENLLTESHTGKVFIHGQMVKFTKVSGWQVSKKAKEFGKVSSVILTLASGDNPKRQATVFISGKMEISMKVSGTTA